MAAGGAVFGVLSYGAIEGINPEAPQRGVSVVTVSLRREAARTKGGERFWDMIRGLGLRVLPNTAGCYTAEDAVRTLRLARELLDGHELVKLEVLGDPRSLYPNVVDTLAAGTPIDVVGFGVQGLTQGGGKPQPDPATSRTRISASSDG